MKLTDYLKDNHSSVVLEVKSATLGSNQRKNMDSKRKKEQKECIIKDMVTVLNSKGGVVKIGTENKNYNYPRDGIGLDLETAFCDILQIVTKYLKFAQEENYFLIFVKAWNLGNSIFPIATVKSNLYKRDVTCTNMMNNTAALEFLQEKKKTGGHIIPKTPGVAHNKVPEEDPIEVLAATIFSKTQLKYGEKLTFTESTHVEFKCFKTEKSFQRIKEILPLNVSAFANTDGGYLFIGIDDDKQVTGFEVNDTIESLETGIKNCIEKLPVYHFCKKVKKIEYTYKFLKVSDDEHSNKYVLALRIEKFCCVVFAEEPESWHWEDNTQKQFSAEEWVNVMVNGKQENNFFRNSTAAGKMKLTDYLKDNHSSVVLEVKSATLGSNQRKNMDSKRKKEQKECIIKDMVTVLNSKGGVVKIGTENKNYNYPRDGIGLDLETAFCDILQIVTKYLKFAQEENYFLIFVKAWNLGNSIFPIATVKSNLYKRDVTCTNMMNNTAALEFLQEKKKTGGHIIPKTPGVAHNKVPEEDPIEVLAATIFSKTQLKYGEKLTFTESTHVEFKCFKTEKSFQRIKEILPLNVSAFANTDGGYLFIGIDDDKQVTGFEVNDTIESLETGIKNCIEKLPVYHFCKKVKKIEYTYKFLKVSDDEHSNKYVLALRIEKFCCVVFAEEPESWHWEDNTQKQFSAEEWVNVMVNGKQGEKGGLK